MLCQARLDALKQGQCRGRGQSVVPPVVPLVVPTGTIPSFNIGVEFDGSIPKRSRIKRVLADEPDFGGVVGGKRCNSFEQIYSTLSPSMISVPDNRLEPSSYLIYDGDVQISEVSSTGFQSEGLSENELAIIEEVPDAVNESSSSVSMEQNREQTILNEIQEPAFMDVEVQESASVDVDLGFDEFNQAAFDREMQSSERNGTSKSNSWVKNKFNEWRLKSGLDVSVSVESIPLCELAEHLCKFFYVLKKKNGEFYPSQSIMGIYKGFNRIFCAVQRDRINVTGINEPQFVMHAHPYFGRVNKSVILAMKKSIVNGANKARRKVDYFTDEDERRILAHPDHQTNSPTGVQKRFVFFCCSVFIIRGDRELWQLRVIDFTLGYDERGKEVLRYTEPTSKNHQPSLTKYQQEHFRESVYSYDPDVINMFKVLLVHMPQDLPESAHLFLSPIQNPKDRVWFKAKINLGECKLRSCLREMASASSLKGDYTNKSGRVTAITRMSIPQVPLATIAANTGHKNVNSLQRYDRSSILKTRAAQVLARSENGMPRDFQSHYEIKLRDWNHANNIVGCSIVVNEDRGEWRPSSPGLNATSSELLGPSSRPSSNEAVAVTGIEQPLSDTQQPPTTSEMPAGPISTPARPCFISKNVAFVSSTTPIVSECTPSSLPNLSQVSLPTPTTLVEEEMRFWSEFDFESENVLVPPTKVAEAPQGTRFAMQRNVALLQRENAILKEQLSQAIHEQKVQADTLTALHKQVANELKSKQQTSGGGFDSNCQDYLRPRHLPQTSYDFSNMPSPLNANGNQFGNLNHFAHANQFHQHGGNGVRFPSNQQENQYLFNGQDMNQHGFSFPYVRPPFVYNQGHPGVPMMPSVVAPVFIAVNYQNFGNFR